MGNQELDLRFPAVPGLNAKMLLLWQDRMGFSQDDAVAALGCTPDAWVAWTQEKTPVPRFIGLACNALALGMEPLGAETKEG